MNYEQLNHLIAKCAGNNTPIQPVDKLSKLFVDNETIKSLLPTDTTGIDNTIKLLDSISELLGSDDARKRDAQIHRLNKDLINTVYIFGSTITAFDYIYFVLLHPWIVKLNDKERFLFCNVTRWFNFVQNTTFLGNGKLDLVPISTTPPPPEPPKEKKPAAAPTATAAAGDNKNEKKADDKQAAAAAGGDKKKGSGREKPAAEPAKPLDVSRFEIRVGKIVEVGRHETAEQLYVEKIDLGESTGPRTIASGLVKFVPIEEMRDRLVLVLCNLKPRNLKGVKSEGMVLCASNADHTAVEFVDVPATAQIGERVSFAEFPGEHDKVLKPETVEEVLKELKTNADRVATYKGCPFQTTAGQCIAKSLANASIS
ncbi:endothelial monocyte-activating polypeptide II precursor pro-EMAP II family protein [Heterostelium album PN500]|uniref:Endothelial monocyte-activating polypeptide II pro-EMAP II family protein n=1 Tax=Heterostelium pallidum (strain ATCC 26659 / Pp 5 / PN500) TaxID=670386 RepID=D3BK19_HETP5|nr:endothelial monocyte-activating polypeptide II precursor pro-EMAP II family protein [Heterostelium album PN500]EFA78249.1 endothelial monocyte-activating polypeptide II precursor pro-EMAP II family protein [Heterostelium album PN500]|eukprot:XP_020430374.1 endothelial monocyte-activating polypeptide II precursor pro-EMAP II family protein [Heterostelium album PN500]